MSATLTPSRRRALRIIAGAASLGAFGAGVRAFAPSPRLHRWQGEVLGATAEIVLWRGNENIARGALRKIESELLRYHRIFSLNDPHSEISRLNRDGHLERASSDLRELVGASQKLAALSDGAFDVTVQPLWSVYEQHFWSKSDIAPDISARALETARMLVDYRAIDINARNISFARKGMAITLNGIAQGFITDAIADLLRNEGFDQAFIDLGEMRALGAHPEGRPWRVDLKNPARSASTNRSIELTDAALAVSGGYGTTFEASGRFHHLFDPRTGASAARLLDVAVIGPSATVADGLSTAIYVGGEERAAGLLKAFPGHRAIFTRPDGSSGTVEPA